MMVGLFCTRVQLSRVFCLFFVLIFTILADGSAQEEMEISFHDGNPWGGDWLYPTFNEAAGFFAFPIEWEPWMESIEFTNVRFWHTEEPGRQFRILLIKRDYENEEYRIVRYTGERETTCVDCWEEVTTFFQEVDFLASFNRCYGLFVNILPDNDQPLEPFIIWNDGEIDHPLSSALISYSIPDDILDPLPPPSYNSDRGYGEYLIEADALIWGTTPTGETTFSEIKLKFGGQ